MIARLGCSGNSSLHSRIASSSSDGKAVLFVVERIASNCAQSLPELKRSTDTPHGTQTGLQVRTAPDVEKWETGNNQIDQPGERCQHNSSGFLSFTNTQERGFIEHRLNLPNRQHVPVPWKRQKHSSTTTMLVPSQVCNIRQKKL